jgi:hypothetical protein
LVAMDKYEHRVGLFNKLYGCMVRLYGVVHCKIVATFEGSVPSFSVFIVQVWGVPFNGQLPYTSTSLGAFSGVGGGVGAGVSLGKIRAGRLLILRRRGTAFPSFFECVYARNRGGEGYDLSALFRNYS